MLWGDVVWLEAISCVSFRVAMRCCGKSEEVKREKLERTAHTHAHTEGAAGQQGERDRGPQLHCQSNCGFSHTCVCTSASTVHRTRASAAHCASTHMRMLTSPLGRSIARVLLATVGVAVRRISTSVSRRRAPTVASVLHPVG